MIDVKNFNISIRNHIFIAHKVCDYTLTLLSFAPRTFLFYFNNQSLLHRASDIVNIQKRTKSRVRQVTIPQSDVRLVCKLIVTEYFWQTNVSRTICLVVKFYLNGCLIYLPRYLLEVNIVSKRNIYIMQLLLIHSFINFETKNQKEINEKNSNVIAIVLALYLLLNQISEILVN